jgi:ATP-dependent 26S proteasome regulatory subunit
MAEQPTIKNYLVANYPCVLMQTQEPNAAETEVRRAMVELNLGSSTLAVWKCTTGLRSGLAGDANEHMKSHEDIEDFLEALGFVQAWNPEKHEGHSCILVCHNVRQFIDNFQIVQQLADSIEAARITGNSIVLIGTHVTLPPELQHLITYHSCKLPTKDQIAEEFASLLDTYSDDIELPEDSEEMDALVAGAANAAVGLTMIGAENALALTIAMHEGVDVKAIHMAKAEAVRKSDVLEYIDTAESMETVGGFDALKADLQLKERVFTDEAREYGLPYPKGMLIVGPAGTGKSLTAKACSTHLKIPLVRMDMGKIMKSLVGESERAIRMALDVIEAVSPVVLWIDEIDKGLKGGNGSGENDGGVMSRVVTTLLTWRQETTSPVMLVATANDVETLPSMLYRRGRLDEVWATDLPQQGEREVIFCIHIRKKGRDPDDYKTLLLAKKTDGFVGAEIEGVIEDAMFKAFNEGVEFTSEHILEAISLVVPQSTRDETEVRAIREWCAARARSVSTPEVLDKKNANSKVRQLRRKNGGK